MVCKGLCRPMPVNSVKQVYVDPCHGILSWKMTRIWQLLMPLNLPLLPYLICSSSALFLSCSALFLSCLASPVVLLNSTGGQQSSTAQGKTPAFPLVLQQHVTSPSAGVHFMSSIRQSQPEKNTLASGPNRIGL